MSLEKPLQRVPYTTEDGALNLQGYILLQGYYEALQDAAATIQLQADEIIALNARVEALEP